jgi:sphingosine kinase
MATTSNTADDPFVDPRPESEDRAQEHAFTVDCTLAVGKNASLTLGTDSLIVLGKPYPAPHRYTERLV